MRWVLITLECPGYIPLTARCGSLTYIKAEGVSWFLAAEGNEGDVIDKCDSRCSQVPWIDVRVVSSGLSHSLQFVQQYWYIGLHSLLFRRSMLRVVFNF